MAVETKTKHSTIKSIDDVPIKLKKSQLYKYPHYAALIDSILQYVVPFWNNKWRFTREFNGIINKRKLSHELEESVPALHFVLQMINDIIMHHNKNKNNHKLSIPIIDLCSGKGILSMLIISFIKLVPKYNPLCQYIHHIILMDRSWNLDFMEIEEMKSQKYDYTKQAKCPIKSEHLPLLSKEFEVKLIPIRTNIHNKSIIHFIQKLSQETIHCNIILVSIHLCRRLSVRAIQIFNSLKSIYGFLLAPCCLPLRGGHNIRIGPLWTKTYHLWSHKDKANIDVNEEYLMKGINNDNDKYKCCFQLTLLAHKQIHVKSKQLANKYKLNQYDMERLNECEDDLNSIDIGNKENKMLIVAEMTPKDLFELDINCRYHQWITFLFNGIDTNNDQKRIYRVPLTGNEHRCDAYLTVQRS